jgi:hypothetical protein
MGYKYKTLEEAANANKQKAKEYYKAHREEILQKYKHINDFLKNNGQQTLQQQYYYKNKDIILKKLKEKYQEQKEHIILNS